MLTSPFFRRTQHDCALVNTMRRERDNEAAKSAPFRALCDNASFGTLTADTTMSAEALSLQLNYPNDKGIQLEIDKHVFTRLLRFSAMSASGHFRSKIGNLFPEATFEDRPGDHVNIFPDDEEAGSELHRRKNVTIAFATVKGLERTLVKFDEYRAASAKDTWPVTPQIKDTLRCKIEAPDGNSFVRVIESIMAAFDVRLGNGRFKNNLRTTKHQPPNILINIVVCPPGLPSITAEVQIYLMNIQQLIEHRYYEVCTRRLFFKLLHVVRIEIPPC